MEMTVEQRQHAGKVHKDFFDRCQNAIDNGFYLEAMFMEYAAMEGRMKVIMSLFKNPCSLCDNTQITHNIGLPKKMECFLMVYETNPALFEKSKLPRSTIRRMMEFCIKRNKRIHGLLENTDEYDKLMSHNKKLATKGLEYCKLLYNETNRLKRISKNHPEMLLTSKLNCPHELDDKCLQAKEWIKKEDN